MIIIQAPESFGRDSYAVPFEFASRKDGLFLSLRDYDLWLKLVAMSATGIFLLFKTAIQTVLRTARGAFPFYWECHFIHRHVIFK